MKWGDTMTHTAVSTIDQADSRRLFAVSFAAIMATSFCFVLRALVIDDWGIEFALSETQKGELLGVGLWPFAITIVLLSFVIDKIGFKATFWFAGLCHLIGLAVLLMAEGYWSLYIGTFIMALGNGAVEAAANPLIATVYSHDKPRWLNKLHAAWPGGMILGGLLAMTLGSNVTWEVKVGLMFLPVLVYVGLLLNIRFPASERLAAGVPYKEMLGEAGFMSALIVVTLIMLEIGRIFALSGTAIAITIAVLTGAYAFYARKAGRPLYVLFVLLMIPLATTELSTDSWITSLMEPEMRAIGLQAGWVLVYTAFIVFIIRLIAGNIIAVLTPLGTLAAASLITAIGLFFLAGSSGLALLGAATLYGIGKSFFWGTSLAVASDQFPKGGAVTINILAGAGMLAAGIVGSVLLGTAQDLSASRAITAYDQQYGTNLKTDYITEKSGSIIGTYHTLDKNKIASAPEQDKAALQIIRANSKKDALKDIALLPAVMLITYLFLMLFFKMKGGYKPVRLEAAAEINNHE
jgi:MFS family permease